MMLISSLCPLFILVGIRGIDEKIIAEKYVWYIIVTLIVIPFVSILIRIKVAKRNRDLFTLNTSETSLNKEYLFAYLLTVLLPLYSVAVSGKRDLYGILGAIFFVIFILWNLNMHFINVLFAFSGYKVYTLTSNNAVILLSTRQHINADTKNIIAHRLSNSVYIEIKNYQYDNK